LRNQCTLNFRIFILGEGICGLEVKRDGGCNQQKILRGTRPTRRQARGGIRHDGYDSNTLSICLGNVNTERGKAHRVFIAGASVARILASERPFNLEGLKERLEKVFPNMVQLIPEARVIIVMGKIRLNETGVIEGTGPAADRVRDIFTRFKTETQG
jgi:hypothetical protein